MSINSKQKGKTGELEAVHALYKLFKPQVEDGKMVVRRGQQYSGDPTAPDVIAIPGIHFEIKRVQALNLDAAIEQAANDSSITEVPIVMHRKNHKRWKVTFYFDDWLKFLDRCNELLA